VRVFISWSGEPSRSIAHVLNDWLESVLPQVEPWISDEEIDSGARWNEKIAESLDETNYGVVCLTRSNQHAPWLMFEAGALAKSVKTARVVPLCIDLPFEDVTGPLAALQKRRLNEDDLKRLLHDMNQATEKPMEKDRLDKIFRRSLPEIDSDVKAALENVPAPKSERKVQDMMAEVVETVRRMDRRLDEDLTRAYERALRLDEVSYPIDPQMGRPFVATTGQGMNPRPQEIYAVTRSRSASPWDHQGPSQGPEDVTNRESSPSSE
jgi:hypothetical protein